MFLKKVTIKIDYYHVSEDVVEKEINVAVVIDVLRATTTICNALANGAKAIQVFDDLEDLQNKFRMSDPKKRLSLGERGGKKIDGFDLGNSPLRVVREVVADKQLFMSTTNGTKALKRVQNANSLFCMSLNNRRAVGERLIDMNPKM